MVVCPIYDTLGADTVEFILQQTEMRVCVCGPSEVLKVGDIVRVKVLSVDTAKKRIALTMKGLH